MGVIIYSTTYKELIIYQVIFEVRNNYKLEDQFFTQKDVISYQNYWMHIEAQRVAPAAKDERTNHAVRPVHTNHDRTTRLLEEQIFQVACRIDMAQTANKIPLGSHIYVRGRQNSRSPSASPPGDRPQLIPSQVHEGRVLFLPHQEHAGGCFKYVIKGCKNCDIQDGAFNHPVVVIRKTWDDQQTSALCCLITSRPPKDPLAEGLNLPIFAGGRTGGKGSNDELNKRIYLEEGTGMMHKPCYIQTNHVYSIPLSKLRTFGSQKLSNKSLKSLTSFINLETEDQSS